MLDIWLDYMEPGSSPAAASSPPPRPRWTGARAGARCRRRADEPTGPTCSTEYGRATASARGELRADADPDQLAFELDALGTAVNGLAAPRRPRRVRARPPRAAAAAGGRRDRRRPRRARRVARGAPASGQVGDPPDHRRRSPDKGSSAMGQTPLTRLGLVGPPAARARPGAGDAGALERARGVEVVQVPAAGQERQVADRRRRGGVRPDRRARRRRHDARRDAHRRRRRQARARASPAAAWAR